MGFHAPLAALLFLLSIPLIVLYFLKLRRPAVQVPSLVLWRQVLNDQRVNSPFQKFKRNTLLLLQLLLLLFLVLAAMQPYWLGDAQNARRLPILIDSSASMGALDKAGGKRRLDHAIEEARRIIDGLAADEQVCLISFAQGARKLTGFTNDRRLLHDALDQIDVQDIPSNLDEALRLAEALARAQPFSRVLLLTDGNVPAKVEFDLPFTLDYQRLPEAGPNAGITGLSARRSGGGSWEVFASLEGSSRGALTGNVELVQDGTAVASQPLTIDPGQVDRIVFSVAAEKPTLLQVRFTPDGFDSLASDNTAYLQLAPARPLRVFTPPTLPAFRLGLSAIEGVSLFPADGQTTSDTDFDLLVTDRHEDAGLDAAVKLFIGIVPDDLLGAIEVPQQGTSVIDWQRLDPLLQHVELSEVIILDSPTNRSGVTDADFENAGYQVVAYGQHGPLLLKQDQAGTLSYRLLIHTDRSTLPYRVGFPILLANLTRLGMQRAGLSEATAARTGTLPPLQARGGERYSVAGPGYSGVVEADARHMLRAVPAPRTGVYEISRSGELIWQQGVSLLSPEETSLTSADRIEFRELSVAATGGGVRTDRSFWSVLAAIALLVLLIEWWFFNRRITFAPR